MTQPELDFSQAPKGGDFCRVPEDGTQCKTLLLAMQRGERLRPLEAALKYQVMALSQRIGDLKRKYGWQSLIKTQLVETPSGKHISEYWMDPA